MSKEYFCEPCFLKTKNRRSFKNHLKCKKHETNIAKHSKLDVKRSARNFIESITIPQNKKNQNNEQVEKAYKCRYCDDRFVTSRGKNRHQKACSEKLIKKIKKRDRIRYDKKNSECFRSKVLIREKNKMIKREVERAEMYRKLYEEEREKNKKVTTNVNHVKTNYKNATELQSFSYSEFRKNRSVLYITGSKTKDDGIVQDVIYSYKHGTLDSYVGDVVLAPFRDVKPENREIWVSDESRLKFIARRRKKIKYVRGKKKGKFKRYDYYWYEDVGGDYVSKKLVDPTLQNIRGKVQEFQKKYCKKQEKYVRDTYRQTLFMRKNETLIGIIREIDDERLHKKILRYIAPRLLVTNTIKHDADDDDVDD